MVRISKLVGLLACAAVLSACSSAPRAKEYSAREKAELYLELANASLSEGDAIGALVQLNEAEKFDPTFPAIYHSRAVALVVKKDLPGAEAAVKKAIELGPNYTEAYNTGGKILLDQGKYSEAEVYLKKAASDPLNREAYKPKTSLGILYYRQGDYAKSAKELDEAIELNSNLACVANYYRGHIWLQEKNFEKSLRAYERASSQLCADFADAHFAVGIALSRSKQFDRARKKFLEITKLYPNSSHADHALERLRFLP